MSKKQEKTHLEDSELVVIEKKGFFDKILIATLKTIFYPCAYISMLPSWILNGGTFYHKELSAKRGNMVKTKDPDGSLVLRRIDHQNELLIVDHGLKSVPDMFKSSVLKYADREYMGTREILDEREFYEESLKKKIKKVKMGDYKWITYRQAGQIVDSLSAELRQLGHEQYENIAIFADTAKEWMLSAYAVMSIGCAVTTVYSLLTDSAIIHCLNLTKCQTVFVDKKSYHRLMNEISQCPHIQIIIALDFTPEEEFLQLPDPTRQIRVLSFATLSKSGKKIDASENVEISAKDLAFVMFTSGSTGVPKGVRITHHNLVTLVHGISYRDDIWYFSHTYVAYLPLGHIMEIEAELIATRYGHRMGYSSPLTLTDLSPMIEAGTKGDLTILKPTLFIFVPLLLERISAGILQQIRKRSKISQAVFEFAFNYKRHLRHYGYTSTLFDALIFNKTKAVVGGQVKLAIIGGASVSIRVQEFVTICLCSDFKQGYGLTETTGGGTVCEIEELGFGHVGAPMACCEIKLKAWKEGGYDPQDIPNARGEILIHGSNVADGYYLDDEQTAMSFVKDPLTGKIWFHSGDIGEILETGVIKIIDRKKDIVKLRHGEYVPLAKLEGVFQSCKYAVRCCICPNKMSEFLVLLLSPDIPSLKNLISILYPERASTMSLFEIINDSAVMLEVRKDVTEICNSAKLNKFEIPSHVFLVEDIWSPDNDMLTPSLKLKRKSIANKYSNLLE